MNIRWALLKNSLLLFAVLISASWPASEAQAGGARLRRTYSRISNAGVDASALRDRALNEILEDASGRDLFDDWRGADPLAAGNVEATTLGALASAAQSDWIEEESCYSNSELNELFRNRIKNQHVVVNQRNYDPRQRVGFCFGRALVAHTQSVAMKRQVPVLKMWVVGRLERGEINWRYHVTTLVLGCDRKWYTLDTLFSRPLTAAAWVDAMKTSYGADPSNRYLVSRPDRVDASGSEYDEGTFKAEIFGDYFKDYLRQNPELRNIR